jgi:hypothetical protein
MVGAPETTQRQTLKWLQNRLIIFVALNRQTKSGHLCQPNLMKIQWIYAYRECILWPASYGHTDITYLPLSIKQTDKSFPVDSASCLRRIDAARPAGPPPTIKTSKGILSRSVDVDRLQRVAVEATQWRCRLTTDWAIRSILVSSSVYKRCSALFF